jgi:hypothetical protein
VIVEVSESSNNSLVRYTSEPFGEGDEFVWTVTLE